MSFEYVQKAASSLSLQLQGWGQKLAKSLGRVGIRKPGYCRTEYIIAILSVITLPASSQPKTNIDLANSFAPLLLHPSDEPNLPANAAWFIPKTSLSFHNADCPQDNKNFGNANVALLQTASVISNCDGHKFTASGTRSASRRRTFVLSDVPDPFKKGLSDPTQWDTYYHVYRNDLGGRTIQYWSFYPFNTGVKIGPIEIGYHGGDWEMVAVMLNQSDQPTGAFMTGHRDLEFVPWANVEIRYNHPVFYTEKGSHESHTMPTAAISYIEHSTWKGGLGGAPGQQKKLVGNLIDLGTKLQPKVGFLSYSGLWGSLGITPISSGYWGPAFNETGMPANSFLAAWCYRIADPEQGSSRNRECYPDDVQ